MYKCIRVRRRGWFCRPLDFIGFLDKNVGMSNTKTPLTFEMFEEALLPRIEEILDEKIEKYRVEVLGFKEEVLGEIKNLRDEVLVVNHQYDRTNKRVDKLEKLLTPTQA